MADNNEMNICKCGNKVREETQNSENQSFAMMMLNEASRNAKRWFAAAMTILVMWLATIGLFVWYLNQYNFESETVVVDSNDGGNANYQTGDGVINNGESDSN